MAYPQPVEAGLVFVVLASLSLWTAFWVIRLAVRHGMNDALRMNRNWLSSIEEKPRP
jgi:hypothetical protein